MEQNWFEMPQIRRRNLGNAVWLPLRAVHQIEEVGVCGHVGYRSEFYGAGTVAIRLKDKQKAEGLGWTHVGINHTCCGRIEGDEYLCADVLYAGDFYGVHLVMEQRGNSAEQSEWHLHQDLVMTLGLKREEDVWIRPDEGYVEVARLHRAADGSAYLLEVRASHLKDYLCARAMALLVTSYRDRVEIFEDAGHISWPQNPLIQSDKGDRWEGRISEIHEGGTPFGAKTAVFHMGRTDVDPEEDVPVFGLPTDDAVTSESWTLEDTGRKLYRVEGELWRNEWIEPASQSPIVRGDKVAPTVFFIVDAEGRQENRETLVTGRRWLWFRPEVMSALAHRRGGALSWCTRDTGMVRCSPDYSVHFGMNPLGLINIYAKDIALLPDWQQRIWSGYNMSPEGKVSEELLASQMAAEPANTQAPEDFLEKGLLHLNVLSEKALGISIVRQHDQIPELICRTHRFRATDKEGLYALAKDLAKLTADSIDTHALQTLVTPPKSERWGSLKSLEKLLATKVGTERARAMMSPLVGIYELRHADAHLPSQKASEALSLANVDQDAPHVIQGYQLLCACVDCIWGICKTIDTWEN